MKKLLFVLLAVGFSFCLCAQEIPKLIGRVNDYGHMLTAQEVQALEAKLKDFEDSTTTQVVVLTLEKYDNVDGKQLFDYSMDVFQSWKIGQEKKNNGVLFVIIKNLTSKNEPGLRIVTGRGIEGALTDLSCGRIVKGIRPDINAGKFYLGINSGVDQIISKIKNEFKASSLNTHTILGFNAAAFIIIIIVIVLILLFLVVRYGGGYSYSSDSGGGWGGGGDSGGFSGGGGDSGGGGAGD